MISRFRNDFDKIEPNEKDLNANEDGPISTRDKKLVQGCWKIVQKDLINIGAVFFVRLVIRFLSIGFNNLTGSTGAYHGTCGAPYYCDSHLSKLGCTNTIKSKQKPIVPSAFIIFNKHEMMATTLWTKKTLI